MSAAGAPQERRRSAARFSKSIDRAEGEEGAARRGARAGNGTLLRLVQHGVADLEGRLGTPEAE